jgi:hypothetical protein
VAEGKKYTLYLLPPASCPLPLFGDVTSISSQATIESGTTAADNVQTGGGPGSLEAFLGVTPGSLTPPNASYPNYAVDGSAITDITSANAGDILSFNWSFSTSDNDAAFATISDNSNPANNTVFFLTGSSPFSYTFTTTGSYTVGIGVVDVGDGTGVSTLTASNPNFQTIPWDVSGGAAIPAVGGILTLGLFRKFKQVF